MTFHNKPVSCSAGLSGHCPTPKPEDHHLSVAYDCLLNKHIRTYPPHLESIHTIRNLRASHDVVT